MLSRQDPAAHVTTSISYGLGRDGRVGHAFDLGLLQGLGLVLMRWLLERRGWRSLGRRWLGLVVVPRWPDPTWAEIRRAASRRSLLFGLPLLPRVLLALAVFAAETAGIAVPADALGVVTFLGNLPLTVATLAALGAVLRGRDAFYDEAAHTRVARLVDGAVLVAPEQRPRRWFARADRRGDVEAARAGLPKVAIGLSAILVAVYLAEIFFPFGAAHPIGLTGSTMVLFGAMDRELVWQVGQWYRLFDAIFLHASGPHLLANVAVLLAAGWFFEGLVGSGWFLATFLLGGLVASLSSVLVNSPMLLGLGASGAVTALVVVGFLASHRLVAGPRRLWLEAFCLACLLAALQATGKFAWGTIDRADHFGGAAGGLLIGLAMLWSWRRGDARPRLQRTAVATALVGSAALFGSVPLAGFGDAPMSALLIPADQLPKTDPDWMVRATDLARRYPADPRVHVALAVAAGNDRVAREREMALAVAAQRRLAPQLGGKIEADVDMAVGNARQNVRDWPAARDLFSRAIAAAPPGSPEAFSKRADAEVGGGDFPAALQDLRTLARLNSSNADVAVAIANVLFAEREADAALAGLDAALAALPEDALALRARGWIGFFDKRGVAAVADLDHAARLLPKEGYTALWLDIATVRGGSPDRMADLVKDIDLTAWPGPIVQFYLGRIGINALMAASQDADAAKRDGQHCEADFYAGEWDLMQHDEAEAEPLLTEAARTCPKNFYEWPAVRAELRGDAGYRPD